ncbi:TB2/DP1/HVA22-related protein [Dillenia turbinata]|uniref:TB2/DP1/HVA22-related protein n=1 Tax=Dillenia turbinata TaxID=194707 RepID=A0AAN8WCR3_9MAGN
MKKTKGRQRIPIGKLENQCNLQVTFSKRRSGLFKNVRELCILTGAEAAVVVFSPGNKVYSFGHPFVENVVNRFLDQNPPMGPSSSQLIDFERDSNLRELNSQLERVLNHLDMEKRRGEELENAMRASQMRNWWEAPVEELSVEQLQILKTAMDSLKQEVEKDSRVQMEKAMNPFPYYAGMCAPVGNPSVAAGAGRNGNYYTGLGPRSVDAREGSGSNYYAGMGPRKVDAREGSGSNYYAGMVAPRGIRWVNAGEDRCVSLVVEPCIESGFDQGLNLMIQVKPLLPLYNEAKLAFYIYLWYPKVKGTTYVYNTFFRPYIASHEQDIDHHLSQLKIRTREIVNSYWQKATVQGQKLISEISEYVKSQVAASSSFSDQPPLDKDK